MRKSLVLLISFGCALSACQKKQDSTPAVAQSIPPRFLYVASGACYSGTNTTFSATTASNLVYRVNTSTGQRDNVIADYNASPATVGDTPVSVAAADKDSLYVLVENASSGRRIEKVAKTDHASRAIFSSSGTVLSSVLRRMLTLNDGSLLVSRSSGIEKLTSSNQRIGTPFISGTLAVNCGAANTNYTSLQTFANGKILFTNAAASNNRLGVISATGYSSAADCLNTTAIAAPNVNAYPTASVYLPAVNQLIVSYAGNASTTDLNSIYVYSVDETANTVGTATKIYDAAQSPSVYPYLLYGISAMAFDSTDNSLYIATAVSSSATVVNYSIERFAYSSTDKTLTHTGNGSFYPYGIDTKCISSLNFVD